MTAFECDFLSGRLKPDGVDELKWVKPSELDDYPFPTANKKLIAQIRKSG